MNIFIDNNLDVQLSPTSFLHCDHIRQVDKYEHHWCIFLHTNVSAFLKFVLCYFVITANTWSDPPGQKPDEDIASYESAEPTAIAERTSTPVQQSTSLLGRFTVSIVSESEIDSTVGEISSTRHSTSYSSKFNNRLNSSQVGSVLFNHKKHKSRARADHCEPMLHVPYYFSVLIIQLHHNGRPAPVRTPLS